MSFNDDLNKLGDLDFRVSGRLGKTLADVESWRREQASFIVQRGLLYTDPKFRRIARVLKGWNEMDIFTEYPNLELSANWLYDYMSAYLDEKKEEKQLKKLQSDYGKFKTNLRDVLQDLENDELLMESESIVEGIFDSTKSSVAVIPNLFLS